MRRQSAPSRDRVAAPIKDPIPLAPRCPEVPLRLLCISLLLLLFGCAEQTLEAIPEELLGVWRSPAPGYRDRYLELRPDWVLFATSPYTSSMHPIERVTAEEIPGGTRYTVEYRLTQGETVSVRLVHTAGNPGSLQVGHQPGSWVPEAHAHWLKREDASG
jgi:hypothetical protein